MIEHLAVSGSFWFLSLFSLEAKQAEDYMQVFVLHTVMPILDDIWIALVLVFHICCPCLLWCTNIFVAIRQQRVPALFIFIFPSFFWIKSGVRKMMRTEVSKYLEQILKFVPFGFPFGWEELLMSLLRWDSENEARL